MITLEQNKNGEKCKLTDTELDIILTALEHEMQRYNKAEGLISDTDARKAVSDAREKVYFVHKHLCGLIFDPDL